MVITFKTEIEKLGRDNSEPRESTIQIPVEILIVIWDATSITVYCKTRKRLLRVVAIYIVRRVDKYVIQDGEIETGTA